MTRLRRLNGGRFCRQTSTTYESPQRTCRQAQQSTAQLAEQQEGPFRKDRGAEGANLPHSTLLLQQASAQEVVTPLTADKGREASTMQPQSLPKGQSMQQGNYACMVSSANAAVASPV